MTYTLPVDNTHLTELNLEAHARRILRLLAEWALLLSRVRD